MWIPIALPCLLPVAEHKLTADRESLFSTLGNHSKPLMALPRTSRKSSLKCHENSRSEESWTTTKWSSRNISTGFSPTTTSVGRICRSSSVQLTSGSRAVAEWRRKRCLWNWCTITSSSRLQPITLEKSMSPMAPVVSRDYEGFQSVTHPHCDDTRRRFRDRDYLIDLRLDGVSCAERQVNLRARHEIVRRGMTCVESISSFRKRSISASRRLPHYRSLEPVRMWAKRPKSSESRPGRGRRRNGHQRHLSTLVNVSACRKST
jgi:hypothetical protein